ncbi:hypothetical protein Acor_21190 [Acrocarpospora corrugata]|uniref:Uncharacterized protein n=1 Tax=Acrocarpospora corrugata TaxID=35763 RepID=A0A5M3VU03_9ACTN|nr:hypothetical protein Acor_21190 [Acrocarpospora corrugata]
MWKQIRRRPRPRTQKLSPSPLAAGLAAILMTQITGCSESSGQARMERCLATAEKENSAIRAEVPDAAFPTGAVVEVASANGCDSANSGAWVYVVLAPESKERDIARSLATAGWSEDPTEFKECSATDCSGMLLRRGTSGRLLSAAFDRHDHPSPSSFRVTVSFIDACWTDDGYFADAVTGDLRRARSVGCRSTRAWRELSRVPTTAWRAVSVNW